MKRPVPLREVPKGPIKFEPNPYPENSAQWMAYERYKGSPTIEAFFGNRGTDEDLVRDHGLHLVSGPHSVMTYVRELLQQPKKAKTGSQ